MEKVEQYRQYLQEILSKYTQYQSNDDIEVHLIVDKERNHYQLRPIGWRGKIRPAQARLGMSRGCAIHVQIKKGKIWVQQGVSKQDIVLGMHSPFMGQFTDYAIN